jgi:hypothetical protein
MELKTPITILQEYVAKNKVPGPTYISLEENSPEILELDKSEEPGKFYFKVICLGFVSDVFHHYFIS